MITLRPPFRAENMEGLYAKVIKGHVNRIPERFSQDLFSVVKVLLQVSPEKRPSCEQILKSNVIKERIDYFKEIEGIKDDEDVDENNLLKTIRIPKNLLFLSDKLPKPNYKKGNVNNKSAVNSKNISNSNFGSVQNNYRSFNKEKERNKLENKLPPLKINYNNKKKKEFEKEKERILKRIEEKESDSNKEINIEDNNNNNNNEKIDE
jgi:NIMA (never in mitosis gene a)-related kinase